MVAAAVVAAASCTDHGVLPTAPTSSDSTKVVGDTALPDGIVLTPAGVLNIGDVLRASVSDDKAVLNAYLILLDSAGTVRWRSPKVAAGPKVDTLSFSTAGASVPSGVSLGAVVAVRDSSGKFRYGGASTASASDSTQARATTVVFAIGNYTVLPGGGTVGSIDYDRNLGIVVVSNVVMNSVVGIAVDSGGFLPWRVAVGSSPGVILTTPGVSGHLITVNGTGTDISSVNFGLASAEETGRTAVPATSVTIGSASAIAGYSAIAGAATCPTVGCDAPVALLSMPNATDSLALIRTVPLSIVPTPLDINVATPAAFPDTMDTPVTATVSQTDRATGQTTIVMRPAVSRCATFLTPGTTTAPGPLVASSDNGGPVYIVMPGTGLPAACPRILRFDWSAMGGLVPNAVAVAAGRTDPTMVTGALDVAASADGSQVAIASATNIIITDAGLRRIGTIAAAGVRRVTFVRDAGATPIVAVSRGTTIDLYETKHFQLVARYPLSKSASEVVAVVRNNQLDIVAATTDGLGMITIRTTPPSTSAAILAQRNRH